MEESHRLWIQICQRFLYQLNIFSNDFRLMYSVARHSCVLQLCSVCCMIWLSYNVFAVCFESNIYCGSDHQLRPACQVVSGLRWFHLSTRQADLTFNSFIHSGHFYSAPSSPLPLRGTPDYSTDTVSEFHAEAHRQLQVKDLPKVPTWRLERESGPQPSGWK